MPPRKRTRRSSGSSSSGTDDDTPSDASIHRVAVPGLSREASILSPRQRKNLHRIQQLQMENSLDESVRREVASEATFTQTFQLAKGLEDSSILDDSRPAPNKRRRLEEPYTSPISQANKYRQPVQRRPSIGCGPRSTSPIAASPIAASARRAQKSNYTHLSSPLSPRHSRLFSDPLYSKTQSIETAPPPLAKRIITQIDDTELPLAPIFNNQKRMELDCQMATPSSIGSHHTPSTTPLRSPSVTSTDQDVD